jgi:phospholipase/carboxylesterase
MRMADREITNFYEHKPAGKPKQIVMLLHGLGANGQDLIGLAPMFAKSLPDALFISPDAPFPCDMAPFGRQWFSLRDWTTKAMLKGTQQASPILQKFIADQLQKHNLTPRDLALVGFSQGTMMSLYTGFRFTQPIAGILGYSGALLWEDDVEVGTLHKTPVCLIHGEADMVVPVTAYHHAKGVLDQAGFTVSGHTVPFLPHGIDPTGIETGAAFLKSVF